MIIITIIIITITIIIVNIILLIVFITIIIILIIHIRNARSVESRSPSIAFVRKPLTMKPSHHVLSSTTMKPSHHVLSSTNLQPPWAVTHTAVASGHSSVQSPPTPAAKGFAYTRCERIRLHSAAMRCSGTLEVPVEISLPFAPQQVLLL